MLFFSDLAKICKKLKREAELIPEEKWQLNKNSLIPFPEIALAPKEVITEIYAQCCVIFSVRMRILPDIHVTKISSFLDLFWHLMETYSNNDSRKEKAELLALIEEACNSGTIEPKNLVLETTFLEKIYTEFIRCYNNTQQKDRGIVYTPDYIIDFMMRFLHSNIQIHFNHPQGLASPELILYDPAIGSLSFELGIRKLIRNSDWIQRQIPIQFYGNELNYAAYFIGRFLLADTTDSPLEINNPPLKVSFQSALTPDFHRSLENSPNAKKKPLVIFGNPPYAVSSANKDPWIYKLMTAYAVKEPNLTRLYDDYVKFMRYGHWLLEKQTQGMLVFITNRKYLDGKVFYGMRQSLLKSMSDIYIIDLFGDARNVKGKSTGNNVFGIQTGVTISLFVKKKKTNQKKAILHYLGIKNGVREMKDVLMGNIQDLKFSNLTPQAPKFLFVPIVVEQKYQHIWDTQCISLPECFIKTSRAMISSRDRFMIHVDPNTLKESITLLKKRDYSSLRKQGRIKKNSDALLENEQILSNFNFDQMENSITALNYRPFDFRYTIFYTINKRCGKSIILDYLNHSPMRFDEFPKLEDSFDHHKSNLAFNFVQSMQKPPFNHILCSQGIVDSGIFGYSTSKVAPIWIQGKLNLSEKYITRMQHNFPTITNLQMIGYIYGILNSRKFATIFEPMLFHEFPRVYMSKDPKTIQTIANLGIALFNLHSFTFTKQQLQKYESFRKMHRSHIPVDFQLKSWEFEKNAIIFNSQTNTHHLREKNEFSIPCYSKSWDFKIGSIQILDHWLKARRFTHLQRGLNDQDWHQFHLSLFIIQETLQLRKNIDLEFQIVLNLWKTL